MAGKDNKDIMWQKKKHIISLKGESHPIFFEKLDVEITMADRLPQWANISIFLKGPRSYGAGIAPRPNMGGKNTGAKKSLKTINVGALRIDLSLWA